ncbi:hypothetical protein BAUCODRAFT_495262 [Baudoinia panamericana UAMH 10762]|uniref:Uncharacterized protein n=1 Tax=Baudoinia panamericana (strain UAMH 10762) TaxID=717646 RepID=M2N9V5_BAUPA|nr:uncharacterized protein BAUCODRAFT_495262 [Baudoinia panamericana UAMH 10762]EMC95605.1 hypothetical protein BAUCODRAFT_495262 [Baudoinia panamericana UAMH 10762]
MRANPRSGLVASMSGRQAGGQCCPSRHIVDVNRPVELPDSDLATIVRDAARRFTLLLYTSIAQEIDEPMVVVVLY